MPPQDEPWERSAAPRQGFFVTTRWSRVMAAGAADGADSRVALAQLCQDYWKPLYFFARRKGRSAEDAQDLTQGFIANLLENQSLARADKSMGRFRSFLAGAFDNYMTNEYRYANAQKRGGGVPMTTLDDPEVEAHYATQEMMTPELLYERSWALALLARGMERLRAEYEKAGRLALYEKVQPIISGHVARPGYAKMAEELGISETSLTVSVHRMRKRYGAILREEIAETVSSEEEVEAELRHLLAAVS